MERARQAALAAILVDVVVLAANRNKVSLKTKDEVDTEQQPYREAAARLRDEADAARRLEMRAVEVENLEKVASAYDRKAGEIGAGLGRLLVKNQHRDPKGDAFVILLVELLRRYFASPFYNTAAAIANVALDRTDLSARRVRQILD
jgi:hypothetical protein